jgi:D-beta-D-heptose 7-phosphate kinase/D-beta-D-heptose 1-phosphate adenosyltransferase
MRKMEELKKVVERFESARILAIGDVMLDRFILGTVSRISPEAPVLVVDLTSETFKPGGAANAINNIRALGGEVIAVGIIGDDVSGKKLIDLLKQSGINTEGIIVIQNRPTIVKTRIIAGQQQIVRIDREKRDGLDNEWVQNILGFVNTKIKDIDAILISDYDKGVITNKLLEDVIPLAKKYNKPIIVDPKVEHFLDYKGVTIVTPNIKEASAATGISPINETSIRNMGQWLLTQLECDTVLITRGKDGMTLFENDGAVIHIPTVAREVFDVTGAGDTVTGVVALCLAVGAVMVDAAIIANTAAGIVVGKLGTATATKEELKHQLDILKEK